jgi:hypothetical protein
VLAAQVALTGKQTLVIGGQSYVGTIDPRFSGDFVEVSHYRLVGGNNSWGQVISYEAIHNDGGVKALRVAQDVAKQVGETIGSFNPSSPQLGSDYIRVSCLASQVLEDSAGGASWWVGFDGSTNVGVRSSTTPDTTLYHVIDWDIPTQRATIGIEDPTAIQIGSQLTDSRFSGTQTVREYTLTAEGSTIQVDAWCGQDPFQGQNRIAELLKGHVNKVIDPRLYVKWRYRVDSQSPDGRLNLIALSDKSPRRMVPNFSPPGMYAQISPGCILLMEFLEGNPDLPAVCPAVDTRDQFFIPTRLTLGVGPEGAASAPNAARQGDTTTSVLPPATFVGTIGGSPATGVVIWSSPTIPGTITSGWPDVGIGK